MNYGSRGKFPTQDHTLTSMPLASGRLAVGSADWWASIGGADAGFDPHTLA